MPEYEIHVKPAEFVASDAGSELDILPLLGQAACIYIQGA